MVQDANLPDSQSAGGMKLSDENAKTIVRERAFIIDIKTLQCANTANSENTASAIKNQIDTHLELTSLGNQKPNPSSILFSL